MRAELLEIIQFIRRERNIAERWAKRNNHDGFPILSKTRLDDMAMYDRWIILLESIPEDDHEGLNLLAKASEALALALEDERRHAAQQHEVSLRALQAKQAEIDRLMLEYCPDEMTPEQIAEWEKHQRRVDSLPIVNVEGRQKD